MRNAYIERVHKNAKVPFLKDRRKVHVLNFMYIRKSRPELMNLREIRTRAHDAHCLMYKFRDVKLLKEVWSTLAQLHGIIWI